MRNVILPVLLILLLVDLEVPVGVINVLVVISVVKIVVTQLVLRGVWIKIVWLLIYLRVHIISLI